MSPQRSTPARGAASAFTLLRRPFRPPPSRLEALLAPERVERVLVVKPHDQLGDFLVATPFLAALRAHYAAARIVLVTRPYLAPLARGQAAVDEVRVVPQPLGSAQALAAFAGVGAFGADVAFVLNSVSRSRTADLIAAWSGARVVVGRSAVGAGEPGGGAPSAARDGVYDLDVPVAVTSIHQVDRLLDFARAVGAERAIQATSPARMTLAAPSPPDSEAGRLVTSCRPPRIGIHPSAANPLKCWPVESFATLIRLLRTVTDRGIFVFGAPRDPGAADAVRAAVDDPSVLFDTIDPGRLEDFLGLVAQLDLMIANDSGVVHIAAALGVPVLSLHSLGRPEEWAPRNTAAIALHGEPIAGIPVEDVFYAAVTLLTARVRPSPN